MRSLAFIFCIFAFCPVYAEAVGPDSEEAKPEEKPEQKSERPEEKTQAGKNSATKSTFMGTNLIHMPSTEDIGNKDLDFHFNHRFGNAKNTLGDFLGLDNGANTRLSLDFGFTDDFSVGLARISAGKTYEANTKYHVLSSTLWGFPVSLSLFGAAGIETEKQLINIYPQLSLSNTGNAAVDAVINQKFNQYELTTKDKSSYLASVLMSTRLTDRFSIQISPMFVHRNFVKTALSNDRNGISVGGRFKITRRVDFTFESIFTPKRDYRGENYAQEDLKSYRGLTNLSATDINTRYNSSTGFLYAYLVNVTLDEPVSYYKVPFSVGVDIETGGHVFQLMVTNSTDLAYTRLLRGAEYDYSRKDWTIGFNIHRFFSFGD